MDSELLIAHQTIFHNQQHPSRVILPIIPTGSPSCTQRPVVANLLSR
jgi:hypothetical protein